VLISESLGFSNRLGTSFNSELREKLGDVESEQSYIIDFLGIFDAQSNVSNTVTVLSQVLGHSFILILIRTVSGGESENDLEKRLR